MKIMKDITVILPAFNAEQFVQNNICILYEYLKTHYKSFEMIVVDDGSTDKTSAVLSGLQLPELQIIRNKTNQGKGYSVARGMKAARGNCRIFTDADLPYDLRAISVATNLIIGRGYHIVVGDRSLVGSNYFERVGQLRSKTSKIFSTIVRLGITGEMYDTQCGFKAFKGDVAQELFGMQRLKGFAFDAEVLYLALKYNLEIRRIPVRYRETSLSTVNPLIDGLIMLLSVFMLPVHWRRGEYKNERLEKLTQCSYWDTTALRSE